MGDGYRTATPNSRYVLVPFYIHFMAMGAEEKGREEGNARVEWNWADSGILGDNTAMRL